VVSVDEERRGLTSSGGAGPAALAGQLSELARSLQAEPDVAGTLAVITAAAVSNIPGADYAAITLVTRSGRVTTPAASDTLIEAVEDLQNQTNQGPCLSTAREHVTIRVNDLATDGRWPLFASRAAGMGVRSMLSFQLFVRAENLGALNLYAREPDVFDDYDEDTGLLFASHAAVALVGAQHQQNSDRALVERDTIGQAKGILMERHKLDAAAAFGVLVRASQESNRKLSEAAHLVASAGVDPAAPPS